MYLFLVGILVLLFGRTIVSYLFGFIVLIIKVLWFILKISIPIIFIILLIMFFLS